MQKEYNKAIRDKIPDIIRKTGKTPIVKRLTDLEYLPYLENKIIEEAEEYLSSHDVDELADLLEVIYRIAELKGVGKKTLNEIRDKKNSENGRFSKNLVLISSDINKDT